MRKTETKRAKRDNGWREDNRQAIVGNTRQMKIPGDQTDVREKQRREGRRHESLKGQ